MIDLSKVALDTREAKVEFTGIPGFVVHVKHIGRAAAAALMDKTRVPKMENGMISHYENDDNKYMKELAKAGIVGWTGLTVAGVEQLMLADLSSEDPSTEVQYTPENAEQLIKSSRSFLNFINDIVYKIDSFRTERS